MASHVKFAKMFADYESNLKNPLRMMNLKGMTMEKISMLMETALDQYASYSLATGDDQWITPTTHANRASTPPKGFKYDNCLGDHFMNQCTKDFNDDRIAQNRKARGVPPSNYSGGRGSRGGRGGRGRRSGRSGRGGGGRGGRGGGAYGEGKFGPPQKNETVRLVDGTAYAACKTCGWNCGPKAHTSGAHDLSTIGG